MKRPKTEVIVAVIGLLGVLGAALIANWDKLFPTRSDYSSTNVNFAASTPGPQPSGSDPVTCLAAFLQGVPKDRIKTLEAGTKDLQIIAPDQPKDQPFGLRLEENRQLVGAIKVQFYSNGPLFKVDSIVDSHCQQVEDFSNASRAGDKHVLQNYDDLQIKFGNATYLLGCEYGAGRIDATFERISSGQ